MTTTHKLLIAATLLAGSFSAMASSHQGAATTSTPTTPKTSAVAASGDMAEGEIRKVDVENKKVTINHGVIKSLDMPAMTMVFQVKEPAMLAKLKAGDKVRFSAEAAGTSLIVTDIKPAQ